MELDKHRHFLRRRKLVEEAAADDQNDQHQQPGIVHRPTTPKTTTIPAPEPPRPVQKKTDCESKDAQQLRELVDNQTTGAGGAFDEPVSPEASIRTRLLATSLPDETVQTSSPCVIPVAEKTATLTELVSSRSEMLKRWETTRRGLHVYVGLYQWRLKFDGEESWRTLISENDRLEIAFCDVNRRHHYFSPNAAVLANGADLSRLRVCFIFPEMQLLYDDDIIGKIERVEVDAGNDVSELEEAGFKTSTLWQWYWENDQKQWQPYQLYADPTKPAEIANNGTLTLNGRYISAEEIESQLAKTGVTGCFRCYVKHVDTEYVFRFNKMVQINRRTGFHRRLRRRPAWFRSTEQENVMMCLQNTVLSANAMGTISLPQTWDIEALLCGSEFQLVPVLPYHSTADEHCLLSSLIKQTLPSATVKRLLRIQNRSLWEDFCRYKKKMQKKRGGREVTPSRLFHGTNRAFVQAICQQGFDWRINGASNGAWFGKGSYFARDARYSADYTDCNTMFIVQVLVGDFVAGTSDMVRPPHKYSGDLYDTCVNDVTDPTIFVTFERQQTYPEYLVEYGLQTDASTQTS